MKYYFSIIFLYLNIYGQSVNITVDKNQIIEGDLIILSIEAINSDDFPQIELNQINKSFEILSGPNQKTNIQFINGKLNSSKTLSWTLSPKQNGQTFIPALYITVDGKKFKGNRIPIDVRKSKAEDINAVFLLSQVDKEEVYNGEQITLSYKLYKHVDYNISSIDQFEMPEFPGFWVEEIFNPQRLKYQKQLEIINGVKYQVANLGERALFPILSEKHILPSVRIKIQLEIQKKRKQRDPFFDPFFNSFFTETKAKILNSKEKKINIKPFPKPIPRNFYGAVGQFQIDAMVDLDTIKINEGLTYTILVKGTGNFNLFTLPEIIFNESIESFQPKDFFEKDEFRNDITGIKKREYILIPRKSGEIKLPTVEFIYFDNITESWKIIKTKPFTIVVERDNPNPNYKNKPKLVNQEIELMDQDIRYIHTFNLSTPIITTGLVSKIYGLSLILILLPFLINRFTSFRFKTKSNREIKGAMKVAFRSMNDKNISNFELASNALYIYLNAKLTLNSINLDPSSVKSLLDDKVRPELVAQIYHLLKLCDEGQFSTGSEKGVPSILDNMKQAIREIDKEL